MRYTDIDDFVNQMLDIIVDKIPDEKVYMDSEETNQDAIQAKLLKIKEHNIELLNTSLPFLCVPVALFSQPTPDTDNLNMQNKIGEPIADAQKILNLFEVINNYCASLIQTGNPTNLDNAHNIIKTLFENMKESESIRGVVDDFETTLSDTFKIPASSTFSKEKLSSFISYLQNPEHLHSLVFAINQLASTCTVC